MNEKFLSIPQLCRYTHTLTYIYCMWNAGYFWLPLVVCHKRFLLSATGCTAQCGTKYSSWRKSCENKAKKIGKMCVQLQRKAQADFNCSFGAKGQSQLIGCDAWTWFKIQTQICVCVCLCVCVKAASGNYGNQRACNKLQLHKPTHSYLCSFMVTKVTPLCLWLCADISRRLQLAPQPTLCDNPILATVNYIDFQSNNDTAHTYIYTLEPLVATTKL